MAGGPVTTRAVFSEVIGIVEGLTPATVTDGEPGYTYVEHQADDVTIDRGFALFITGQRDANPMQSTGTQRWLTSFELEMRHNVSSEDRKNDMLRLCEDRDQVFKELADTSSYTGGYVDAVLREDMQATTREDAQGVFTTVFSFTLHHHE